MFSFATIEHSLRQSKVFLAVACLGVLWVVKKACEHLAVYVHRRQLIKQNGCLSPPLRRSWTPYLGLDNFYHNVRVLRDGNVLTTILNDMHKHAPAYTYSLWIFGQQIFCTADPEVVKHVVATNFSDFQFGQERKALFGDVLGNGIFTNEGKAWKHSRELLKPYFNRDQLDHLPLFEKHVKVLFSLLPVDTGEVVDLQPMFNDLMFEISTEFIFGEAAGNLMPGEATARQKRFVQAFEDLLLSASFPWRKGVLHRFFQASRERKENLRYVHDYVDNLARAALEKRQKQESTIQTKATQSEEITTTHRVLLAELSSRIEDPRQIRDELLSVMVASRDTTATLLSNLFFILAQRPDVVSKLQNSIDSVVGSRREDVSSHPSPSTRHGTQHPTLPNLAQLRNMTYLRHCINEILRLYPIAPVNARTARRDVMLPSGGGGKFGVSEANAPLFVPKGSLVSLEIYSMHRRTDLFGADTEMFIPERWGGADGIRPGWGYLPFHGGPQACIGQQLALVQAQYIVVRFLQTLGRIERPDGEPETWKEQFDFISRNRWGCRVKLYSQRSTDG